MNDKVAGGTLTATEWNEVPSELQNIIEDTGQTLSSGDLDQLGKGVATYAGAGDFYSESGAADAYVLTPIGTKQGPPSLVDGLTVRFRPGNANTGASTINVNALGVKDLEREDGTALSAGDLATTRDCWARYDAGTDDFFVLNSALSGPTDIVHSGAKAKRTTDVTIANATDLEVIMTAEVYDDGGWFAPSSTDMEVITGVTRVLVTACIEIQTSTVQADDMSCEIFKNGASFDGGAMQKNRFGTGNVIWNLACIDNCVATDTYSVNVRNDNGGLRTIDGTGNHVWLAIAALQKS